MHVLDELHARGFVKQCSDEDALRAKMDAGPITFYVGFDPTADSLHAGSLLPMLMAAHLQRAGHRAVLLAGGGTGMVGDPSGKTEARMLLDEATIEQNVEKVAAQFALALDFSDPARGVVLNNAKWLLSLNYIAFLRDIGSVFSVNRMLSAEGYKQRLERGLSFIEFNYQLLQAYDFLVLHQTEDVSLQIGGDDQWGNILAGVDLVRRKEQAQVFALTLPLLVTATGAKMGKTHSGAVWLDPARFSPFDFYQYWLNVDDRDVGRFLKLFTFLPLDEIAGLEALQGKDVRTAKAKLALEVTTLVHGAQAAKDAAEGAAAMVSGKASDDLPTHAVSAEELAAGVPIYVLLADAGLLKSRGEGRRMIKQGAVKLGGERVSDPEALVGAADVGGDGVVIRVGKKRAVRIVTG